jgi:hypothetical protein
VAGLYRHCQARDCIAPPFGRGTLPLIGLTAIARDAGELGWWDSVKQIGERQALYANLESGAATIRTYEQTALP